MKTKLTWRDGTPRSMGGPFDILYEPKRYPAPPAPQTEKEIAEQRNRDSAQRRYYRLKASRNNAVSQFCLPITTPEQSRRTQAIGGKAL